jgi:RNA polymerase sigma factor (sigma-70 family)
MNFVPRTTMSVSGAGFSGQSSKGATHAPPDAFVDRLYRSHARELRGFVGRHVGRQEAEDIVQDAYLHVIQKGTIAALDHPRAYLFRAAANLALDALRKAKRRRRYRDAEMGFLALAEAAVDPDAAPERGIEIRRCQRYLGELPAQCREIFCLGLIDGLTHAEIATRLGISTRTVDRYFAKAFDHLRRKLLLGTVPIE